MLNSSVHDRLDRGEHPRQVLGLAAGHHRGDRDLLDGRRRRGRAARWRRRRTARGSCPSSMRSTRSSVGGTTGSPSVQPRSNITSISSSASASSMRREREHAPPRSARAARRRDRGRRSAIRSPGASPGRSSPSPATPVIRSHSGRASRRCARPRRRRRRGCSVGTVSIVVVPADAEIAVVDGGRRAGEVRVVLRVHGEIQRGIESRRAPARPSGTSRTRA